MCMREGSSLAWARAAKKMTWLVSRSSGSGGGWRFLAGGDDLSHVHARAQLVGLRLGGKDTDLASLEIVEHRARHFGQRARGNLFERPEAIRRAYVVELGGQRG